MRTFAASGGAAASLRSRAIILALAAAAARGEDSENVTVAYVAPSTDGLHWVETFDGDVWSRWANSKVEKYNGAFKVEKRKTEALTGDVGLLVPDEAKHYGIAATFPPLEGQSGVPFMVQFEVRFQDSLSCGGSYLKLYDSEGKEASEFKDDTRYVIMFGPDKCGSTDKVHFILQHKNPKSGAWEEKHCKDPPSVPNDSNTHLYGLVIKPDNSFEIMVDGEVKTSGNLLTSMQPPVNPPKEIDDPTDSKPEDWVENKKMDDPTASKPDDWDEDAPMQIVDPKAEKPAGWLDDAELKIADPAAKKPEDWDEDEDGEWEAPIIDNPACKVGCGKWEPPRISNPAYKGKWHAPMIDNPAYIGVWKARQIANPDYFEDETPALLPTISAVGIDIWTMSKGIIFDNILVATDAKKASAFADQTFKVRKEIEEKQSPKNSGSSATSSMYKMFDDFVTSLVTPAMKKTLELYSVPIVISLIACFVGACMICCRSGTPPPPAPKKKAKKEQKESEEPKAGDENKEEKKKENKKEDKKTEGGLGDISKED
jgi:calnexin